MNRRDLLALLGAASLPRAALARDKGYGMLPEWAQHAACVMAWSAAYQVYSREEVTWIHNDQVRLAKAISRFEPVIMIARPQDAAEAAQRLGSAAQVLPMECTDSWVRDTLPTFFRETDGALTGTIWNFNVWGEKYPGYGADRTLAQRFAEHRGLPTRQAGIVAEGGALDTDGAGTVMTTETCLLHAERNPGMTRAEVEAELKAAAPARHVIWLWGSEQDTVTDGHVDGLARFVRPGLVVAEVTDDTEDPEHADLQENLKRLRAARDARGDRLEVVELKRPRWDRMPERGYDFAPSYVNAYFANGGVILPRFEDTERDAAARTLFARLLPTRQIEQIRIDQIAEGGGGIHCCTMQIPA